MPGRGLRLLFAAAVLAGIAAATLFSLEGGLEGPLTRGPSPSYTDAPPPVGPALAFAAAPVSSSGAVALAASSTPSFPLALFPPIDGHPAGRLRGAVVDDASSPVEGALVSFEAFPRIVPIFRVLTDAKGCFAIDVPSASYHVVVVAPGRAPASDDLHVFPGRGLVLLHLLKMQGSYNAK